MNEALKALRAVSPGFASTYERFLVPAIFLPWGIDLLDRVRPGASARVLDVACGTGIIARLVCESRGTPNNLTGVDTNPEMIAVARSIAPEVDWREANVLALPFGAASFDLVLCQQGLQFFTDRPAAVRQMRRVLADHGRLAVSTWCPLEDNPLFHCLHVLAADRFGAHVDRRHSFGNGDVITALLAEAGFREIHAEKVTRTERVPDADSFVAMNLGATIAALDDMSPEERTEVVASFQAAARAAVAPFVEGSGLVHPVSANVITAVA